MQTLRSRLAILLLLCFTRVLLPEAWVLNLHAHEHTTEEPTQLPGSFKNKALLSAKHQHCAVDHFCNVPFQLATTVQLPEVFRVYERSVATPVTAVWWADLCRPADLRGPPSLS
ncbi:hypothetical protein [Hymenobacter sp. APR13]|uniref:hypothetical protein n=1 Tax=Hymenobacter sp. APR13 TaxID=1356852 RepID=UPI0004E09F8E|nr:hypothetical protein [Hymenobacter sp. APR13]AII51676.1 hypothetical protein N008_06720 [Hymenobacter sp. APR13]